MKMYARIAVPLALVAAVLCWQAATHGEPTRDKPTASGSNALNSDGSLIVHEWGTFTSFSGSDGVKLEFRPLVDNDLPQFVLDRARQAGTANPFSKLNYRVLQRMETPITYFYTDRPREVNVRVGFPNGLLTEFYPPVKSMTPKFDWKKPAPVGDSTLDWGRILVIPEDRFQVQMDDPKLTERLQKSLFRKLLRRGVQENHYEYARETDAAMVLVRRDQPFDKQRPLAPRGDYFEKFLFYRGVGNFDLPLEMKALGGDRFSLTNKGGDSLRSLFLVSVEGDQLRFAKTAQVLGGQTVELKQSPSPRSIGELSEQVVDALIEEGLYEKEARAMVKTWSSSWFGEPGTRLFYMLPRPLTDGLLPLTVEPKPVETVRVLVGRLEIMSPEDEARATKLVDQSADRRAAHYKKKDGKPYSLPNDILGLGRLAEPALIRIKNIAKAAKLRHEATALLREVESYRNAQTAAVERAAAEVADSAVEVEEKKPAAAGAE